MQGHPCHLWETAAMKTISSRSFRLGWTVVGLITGLAAIGGSEGQAAKEKARSYPELKSRAEAFYAEGSYGLSRQVYLEAKELAIEPTEQRWVGFRLADTLWRTESATQTADTTKLDQARQQLEELIRPVERQEQRDRIWAEVNESLGDFWWTRQHVRNWGQAWPYYQNALEFWAGLSDIELARARYLKIVWAIVSPPGEGRNAYGYYGNLLPAAIVENVLKIVQTDADKAHAHYLMAMTLKQQGDMDLGRRVPQEFEAALATGKSTDWYDDAMYHYADWLATTGPVAMVQQEKVTTRPTVQQRKGRRQQEPDYVKALSLFRKLLDEFAKGETAYYDQAQDRIREITSPVVGVSASNLFLANSEIQVHLNWRNVKTIDLAIYKVNLTRDVELEGEDVNAGGWVQQINRARGEKVTSWSYATQDKGDYKPGDKPLRVESPLPPGAYVIEAKGQGASASDLILVTDASLVVKTAGRQALVYFANALDSSPIADGQVVLWQRYRSDSDPKKHRPQWVWEKTTKGTNADGVCVFDLIDSESNVELFVTAGLGDRQSFSMGGDAYRHRERQREWRIYAFTDRPAYRPDETVHWKFIARQYDGATYSTPADQILEFEIKDPRGTTMNEGKSTLNAFGSAWGELALTATMPLGEYRIEFWTAKKAQHIGSATLFRLEEYKLPEFKVSVETPKEDGRQKTFRLGERVEVTLRADYYFGGPVADANVEVIVYQTPFYHTWEPPREFPWYYDEAAQGRGGRYGGGQGQIVKREQLKTDATGKAALTFDTPQNTGQDFEYRIEARVTDASRREIVGSNTVRVTRQRYYVYLRPEHSIYQPNDKVQINVKSIDANKQPLPAEGLIKVTRDYWVEIRVDAEGKEMRIDGQRSNPQPPGKLKSRGYQHEEIVSQIVKTGADGEAEFTFTPAKEGFYRVAWTSDQDDGPPIQAETSVHVATDKTTESGYHYGGVQIIADKDTFVAGQSAAVMISVPTSDRYVLFTVEGDDLYQYQLVHVSGTVKLIELPIEEKHVPNIFLAAAMVSDGECYVDSKEIIVPPVKQFLKVNVKSDREEYQPRQEGTLTISTTDHDGKPISAEVALGLVDESVYYIQQDYAGDPRQFYYGTKRSQRVQIQNTFNQRRFVKPAEEEEQRPVDSYRDEKTAQEMGGPMSLAIGGPAVSEDREDFSMSSRGAVGHVSAVGLAKAAASPMPAEESPVQVRTDFRATALWHPEVTTDSDGKATVKITYPDSLTTWKATARVATSGNQFGIAEATTRTKKPLIVRLQAPRFFVVGDRVTLSAVINNNTDQKLTVQPSLTPEGLTLPAGMQSPVVDVPANGEARVDWLVAVEQSGQAKLKVSAVSDKYTDAMEKTYPVYEHGIEKFVAKSGKVRGDDITVTIDIPVQRKPDTTSLVVQVTPSLAVTMLDALPYLIDYPYGCTEQTMSRFMPAAIVARTLSELGLNREDVAGRLFGGIEQHDAEKTHPDGKRDLQKLNEMIAQGLDRLYDFQHGDGGWGWWKEGDSDHFMSAYIVWGLTLARDGGIEIKPDVLHRGLEYVGLEIVEEEDNYDMQAWMLHALIAGRKHEMGNLGTKAFSNLWQNRDKLNACTRALLALSAHALGQAEQAQALVRNIENGVKIDTSPDTSVIQRGEQGSNPAVMATAHWGEDGIYQRWSDGGVEATAFALRAMLAIDPGNKLIEPVTNWLIKNRRGAQWSNTRDTAIAVLAMTDYLRQSGELASELEYELWVNGQSVAARKIAPADILSSPSRFEVDRKLVKDGTNEIRIVRKSGKGPIYFAAQATFFSLEEPITPAGNEIFVRRQYYKYVGRPTLLKGYVYDKVPLNDGESIVSGERVEVVATIEAKNNYEYLVFEDFKPAGLEAVKIRSGQALYARELKRGAVERKFIPEKKDADLLARQAASDQVDYTGRQRWIYQELRDRKVAMFIDKLPEGVWEIRYDLRAEVPGEFHGLPLVGYAMYVPEIRANGAEVRIAVEDVKR